MRRPKPRLAWPKHADFCASDMLETDGSLRRVALAALDVDVERANWATASRYRRDPLGTHPVWDVLRFAKPILWEEVDPDRLQRLARSNDHLRQLLERGICAWMGVPLLVNGQVRGSMSFTNAESQRLYFQGAFFDGSGTGIPYLTNPEPVTIVK